ncbi:lysostaphin resistance A-like protein, partial [Muriicola sp.]|uniref:CPBP family intramembrane glutamic endopeptidase n=1 Tax=Muriicola sp. TaxID=2020856 RepID=UPI003C75FDDE
MDKERFIQLGFQTKNRGIDFIYGIGLGLLILGLGYGLLIYMKEIFIVKIIFDPEELILVVIHFTIVAIVEEALCRGYILKNLMVSFNKYVALIVSSLIFSFLHYFNPNIDFIAITDLFFAGILLGISYIYTKNLWFPIALHLSWNLFQTLLGFNVSGQDSYSIIEIDIHQANLLNGGAFGFEGSILAIVAQLFAIIGIAVYY